MNDRDIEDTRTPPERGEDAEDLWEQVKSGLSPNHIEFVDAELKQLGSVCSHWQQQSKAANEKLERIKKMIEGAYEVPNCAAVGVEEMTFDEMEIELSKALHLIEELYDVLIPTTRTA